jgi:hypothetical protein
VEINGVVIANSRGDTALSIASAPCSRVSFGEDENAAVGRELDSSPESRDAAADDQEIG